MAARRRRHEDHEEHESHERWLITYADMITLLMVLFIVLFSIGQTDLAKFKKLKEGLTQSLGGTKATLDGGSGLLAAGPGAKPLTPQIETAALRALQEKQALTQAVNAEHQTLADARDQILRQLQLHGLADAAKFRFETRGLVVTVVTDRVLFDTGADSLRPAGREVLDGMSPALAHLPNPIMVEGHTDDRPITGRFASNWELSTARATSVLRYLVETHGLAPSRLSAAGYADQRPVATNDTDTHRAENRRVEIVIMSEYGAPAGAPGGS